VLPAAPFLAEPEKVTYKLIYDFGRLTDDGRYPAAGLIDVDGMLYGTTSYGGTHDDGTVFSITTTGDEKVMHSFRFSHRKSDGYYPYAGLVDVNGTFYGTTKSGGKHDLGTVFSITASGGEKILHSFGEAGDGEYPTASLIDVSGTLYGTTESTNAHLEDGTVFSITTSGTEKVLHAFHGKDGDDPKAGLVDVNGRLYGTTASGGVHDAGTVFSITTKGEQKVLHSFKGSDGAEPQASLLDVGGVLYGTTGSGGAHEHGAVFKITTKGDEDVLHSFSGSDGEEPLAGLVAVRGRLYGTTAYGGKATREAGTVFSITQRDKKFTETVLYSFGTGNDGETPIGGLLDVNGALWGTTEYGGLNGLGTVFALRPPRH
jgi:uncharacterized repeat protein (TIGR03803 family)